MSNLVFGKIWYIYRYYLFGFIPLWSVTVDDEVSFKTSQFGRYIQVGVAKEVSLKGALGTAQMVESDKKV